MRSVMKRASVRILALLCLCATIIAPPSTRVSAGAVTQTAADVQKLDATDVQRLDAATAFVRERNARDYAIAPDGINEGRYVMIGGIEQWITIRGEDRRNPVLLFLHGGPGDATNPWGYAAFRSWLKAFTVVQWDQRGAGRTLGKSGPSVAATITIDRLTQDGIELAETLRRILQKDKIILVGHSWGSILGVFMAKARPDLFSAFVGTGQVADPQRNYEVAYHALLEKATRLESRAPSASSKTLDLRRTPMAVDTPYNAGGRICSRAPISLSRPWSASHSMLPTTDRTISTTGSTARC